MDPTRVPQSLMAPSPAEAIERTVHDSPLFEKYTLRPESNWETSGSRQGIVTLVETTEAPSRLPGQAAVARN